MNFSWEAPERIFIPKKPDWFVTIWIIAVTIIVLAVIFNNLIFAALVFVATLALTLNAKNEPKMVEVQITERGVRKDDLFYPWSSFISFWIEEDDIIPKLLLESNRRFLPHTVLLIDEHVIDMEELRQAVSTKLEEFEQHEPVLERIFERLGF
ncbi:MAG: hypothetical protein COV34_03375 [Candidatus Zambryskibacteria bacterium CG10_big_fil_rev_8_21_14_0_10_42_12]|uniref:DUF5673 domain-containing protein n=1 Tax=Candidatus Zambryskibacteria bacterium CG10_big_fil_rev_8_21_14_0_10_42_12 TaxID=1975115 RepID=A0A2H0QSJ2_9BACT|nr:MAG: hypothetical protein COV34_03375 [Candidatus Zambryskibacteria bacterium CG10_big_fil_rev_8_21_14_0_10_42_12]